MKTFSAVLAIGVILSLLLASIPISAASQNEAEIATDRIIVKFKENTGQSVKEQVHSRNNGVVISENIDLAVQVVEVGNGKVKEALGKYRKEKTIQYAEPDFIAAACDTPEDPYFAEQWGLVDVDATKAWDITEGSAKVKIAILDTGIDQDHEDLVGKISNSVNFSKSMTEDDLFGHGTHVAGIVAAASNTLGVVGLANECSLLNVKVLGDLGSGYYSDIANGMTWAVDNGARVINMSLGGPQASSALSDAVTYAWRSGVVVVAAAGNDNSSAAFYPAYYRYCIAVAATGQDDAKAYFSNYGKWVDIAAPGIGIYSTLPNHPYNLSSRVGYGALSGTSMATPFVSALAGLLWSTPNGTSNTSVRNYIEDTADSIAGTGTYWSNGKINAYDAVMAATTVSTTNKGRGKH